MFYTFTYFVPLIEQILSTTPSEDLVDSLRMKLIFLAVCFVLNTYALSRNIRRVKICIATPTDENMCFNIFCDLKEGDVFALSHIIGELRCKCRARLVFLRFQLKAGGL